MARNDPHPPEPAQIRPTPRPPKTLPATPPPGFFITEKRSWLMSAIISRLDRFFPTDESTRS